MDIKISNTQQSIIVDLLYFFLDCLSLILLVLFYKTNVETFVVYYLLMALYHYFYFKRIRDTVATLIQENIEISRDTSKELIEGISKVNDKIIAISAIFWPAYPATLILKNLSII